ncbi:hypothetical protein C8B47_26530 [filamentous cyanobacterium CCP4]|nr:hypothetical protein C8B47_26530 [filamentous cyanobacterium CCP4]
MAFGEGDSNTGGNPNITAAAYTNSFAGTTSTALYNIDALLNQLVLQNPPNDGTLVTVGDLGADFGVVGGFDIVSSTEGENAAFAVSDGLLYSIDLNTGAATGLGSLNLETSGNLIGLAAVDAPPTPPVTPDFLTLTSNNTLLGFRAAAPGEVSSVEVNGVEGTLLGIDTRPANGLLYGLTTANNLYTIDPSSGAASLVSTLSVPFEGGVVTGFDFNPVADRLRLVGDNDQNFRINVETGEVLEDGTLAFALEDASAGVNPNVTAAAYTNSVDGTTSTALYNIDPLLDQLLLQSPPNDGTLVTVGDLGIDFDVVGGFDIFSTAEGDNAAFAVSDSTLYTIDLETGAATSLGTLGDGSGNLLGFVAMANPMASEEPDDLMNPGNGGVDLPLPKGIPGGPAITDNLGDLLETLSMSPLGQDLATLGSAIAGSTPNLAALLPTEAEVNAAIADLSASLSF